MEYLTISGTLQLKKSIDEGSLNQLLKKMDTIDFDRHGLVCIERQDDQLSIEVEGEISENIGNDVVSWLHPLKEMATDTSFIMVDCVRWEINITLVSKAQACDPGAVLSSLVRSHDNNKLILL